MFTTVTLLVWEQSQAVSPLNSQLKILLTGCEVGRWTVWDCFVCVSVSMGGGLMPVWVRAPEHAVLFGSLPWSFRPLPKFRGPIPRHPHSPHDDSRADDRWRWDSAGCRGNTRSHLPLGSGITACCDVCFVLHRPVCTPPHPILTSTVNFPLNSSDLRGSSWGCSLTMPSLRRVSWKEHAQENKHSLKGGLASPPTGLCLQRRHYHLRPDSPEPPFRPRASAESHPQAIM